MRFLFLPLALLVACGQPVTDPTPEDLDALTKAERPPPRSEILAIADEPSNTVVVFGGNDGPIVNQAPRPSFHDDTWVFEPGVGWTELDLDVRPPARGRYAASYDPTGRRMVIFGGRWREEDTSGNYTLFNDLWSFDFETRTWTELDAGGEDAPSGRYYAASAWDDEEQAFYVFGGGTNASPMVITVDMNLWKWTADAGWEQVAIDADGPGQRTFLGSLHDTRRNRIVLVAGQIGDYWTQAYNETWALDLDDGSWTELDTGTAFSTRMHPHALYDAEGDRYLVFGGHTDLGDANDLWMFDPESGQYTAVQEGDTFTGVGFGCLGNPTEVPADYVVHDLDSPERRHRGMLAQLHGSLWLFGGMHSECSAHLDDTWRYDLAEEAWIELIPARTGESCARKGQDCECLCY